MNKIFSYNSPFMQKMGVVADLMILNIMWLVCCVPVVTAGAATVALQFACLRMSRGEGSPVKDYWRSFFSNFVQATIIWLIVLVVGALFVSAGLVVATYNFPGKMVIWILTWIIVFVLFNACTFLFPMQAQFENNIRQTFANAFILSIMHFKASVPMSLLNLIPLIWALVSFNSFLKYSILWLIVGVAGLSYLGGMLFNKSMAKYLNPQPEEQTEKIEEANEETEDED